MTIFKCVKVSLREPLSCQDFRVHSIRFLAKTWVPSWLVVVICPDSFRQYPGRVFNQRIICFKKFSKIVVVFISIMYVHSILTDGNIFQIKLFNLLNSFSISSGLIRGSLFVRAWWIILSDRLHSNGTR